MLEKARQKQKDDEFSEILECTDFDTTALSRLQMVYNKVADGAAGFGNVSGVAPLLEEDSEGGIKLHTEDADQ